MTSHCFVELDVARECQAVAEAADARSLTAASGFERVMVAVRKELEDALARTDGLSTRLQVTDAERAKVEEVAKAPAEASAAHLRQLQEAQAQRDGMFRFLPLPFNFSPL